MSASSRPPRRQTSSLVDEHPAFPAPPPEAPPAAPPAEPPVGGSSRAGARLREREEAREREHLTEARARTAARDAAWGWAAATRRANRRRDEWTEAMGAARRAGTLPGVLREYIAEAADRLGVDVADVPAEVWTAAGHRAAVSRGPSTWPARRAPSRRPPGPCEIILTMITNVTLIVVIMDGVYSDYHCLCCDRQLLGADADGLCATCTTAEED
jgi:hypothetical protein